MGHFESKFSAFPPINAMISSATSSGERPEDQAVTVLDVCGRLCRPGHAGRRSCTEVSK